MRSPVPKIAILLKLLATTINYTPLDIQQAYMHNMSDNLAPNQQTDLPTRLQQAKQFLKENPDEQSVTAARIYDLKLTTLYS
jgi:hypothetical protein